MQLRQLDPSLKDDFQIKFPELFTSLNQKTFDIQLLERMSRDFQWNYQKVLITQVKLSQPTQFSVSFHPTFSPSFLADLDHSWLPRV